MNKIIMGILMGFLLNGVLTASLPSSITVIKESGITLRSDLELGNDPIGQVHQYYQYDVISGRPSYFKIKTKDENIGWVYANTEKEWTVLNNNKVYILYEAGLNVREEAYNSESPIVGYVIQGEEYDVLDVSYSYLKVTTPGGKQGWIYAGKPEDPWVIRNDVETISISSDPTVATDETGAADDKDNNCVDSVRIVEKVVEKVVEKECAVAYDSFSHSTKSDRAKFNTSFVGGEVKGDFTVDLKGIDSNRDNQFNSHRFTNPGSSFVELTLDLNSLDYSTLVLEHDVEKNLADKNSLAYISMSVNDKLVVRGMSVSPDGFRKFMMSVKNHLKKGTNSIRIDYLRGSKSDYWLRSVSLK
ncbi:MAG: hypothetical protein CMP39_07495 [Rickettsiales bacterium]|nr:hypothetical protein [Rickettsiales bacterium]|tara:strand:- start:3252 stop:4325 length:1074 start_codon:yes stop_codon:yes gene_type:complete